MKRILNNELYKTLSANGVVVLFKIISSFIVSKITAIYLGPSGYALVGNFKNVLQGILGVTTNGFESGVIKYISENRYDKAKLNSIVSNVFVVNFILCCIVIIPLYFFSEQLAIYTLKDVGYSYVFKYLAFLLPLISFNFLSIYLLNGLQKLRTYTQLVIISNILNALLTVILINFYDIAGALFASFLVPVLSFIATFFFKDIRHLIFLSLIEFKQISFLFLTNISTYLFMALYSSLLISLSYLLIRNGIIQKIDMENAGYWEAMNKISMFYMIFFSSLFTLYLLPRLTENKTTGGYNLIMKSYFKMLVPLTFVSFVILYFLRIIVVKVFLSDEFLQVSQYFYLQLIGDFFKVIAFSLAYQFHAKKMVKAYLITDLIFYGSFYFFSSYFINSFSLYGVFYAYLLSVVLYLILVSIFIVFNNKKYLLSEN